ncbi:hypothetical protein [Streptomyces nigrescens]
MVGRELQRLPLQGHLNLRAARKTRQESVTGAEGVERRTLEPGHTRQLATRFGTVTVTRIAYRAKGAVNLYPADAELNLPLREATRKAAESKGGNTFATRLASGEKQGRKRMATLAAVYDTDPSPARPTTCSPSPPVPVPVPMPMSMSMSMSMAAWKERRARQPGSRARWP